MPLSRLAKFLVSYIARPRLCCSALIQTRGIGGTWLTEPERSLSVSWEFFFSSGTPLTRSQVVASSSMAAAAATVTPRASEHKPKPQKPDEAAFKASLAQAEKEHAAVQEKLVSNALKFQ